MYTPTWDKDKKNPVDLQVIITHLKANSKYKIGIHATDLAGSGPEATISKITSNRIKADIDKKKKKLAPLVTKDKIIIHTKEYDENDSDIFSLTHIGDTFDCYYKISKVSGPDHCYTFVSTINENGCSWIGNSQLDGHMIGEENVYVRNCDKNWKEIEGLQARATTIEENSYK